MRGQVQQPHILDTKSWGDSVLIHGPAANHMLDCAIYYPLFYHKNYIGVIIQRARIFQLFKAQDLKATIFGRPAAAEKLSQIVELLQFRLTFLGWISGNKIWNVEAAFSRVHLENTMSSFERHIVVKGPSCSWCGAIFAQKPGALACLSGCGLLMEMFVRSLAHTNFSPTLSLRRFSVPRGAKNLGINIVQRCFNPSGAWEEYTITKFRLLLQAFELAPFLL